LYPVTQCYIPLTVVLLCCFRVRGPFTRSVTLSDLQTLNTHTNRLFVKICSIIMAILMDRGVKCGRICIHNFLRIYLTPNKARTKEYRARCQHQRARPNSEAVACGGRSGCPVDDVTEHRGSRDNSAEGDGIAPGGSLLKNKSSPDQRY
jgi:hypothetical protein